jgi:ferredoxin-like protein FixX
MSKKDGKARLLKAQVKKEVHMVAINDSEIQECQSVALACPARVIKVM